MESAYERLGRKRTHRGVNGSLFWREAKLRRIKKIEKGRKIPNRR